MSDEKPRAIRPDDVEPDPRTDGVEDDGERELPPPSEDEIARGIADDEVHRVKLLSVDEDKDVW